jgi:mono/diheme cytochrome c family protein
MASSRRSRSSSRAAAAAVLLAAALGGGALLAAAEPLTNPVLDDPEARAEGRTIYRRRCYVCHLSEGGRGPNLFASRLSDEAFLTTVINGRKGTQMPAFGLQIGPDEVWKVHAYVKSTGRYE